MRTGFIFPVSSNVLGAAVIIALIIGAIYVVFYWIRSAAESSQKNSIENEFLNPSSKESKIDFFCLPTPNVGIFTDRSINSDRGYIWIKTSGQLSMAICSHAKLDFLRLCFAIDYTNIGAFQAIVYVQDSDQRHMIKITPETAMFSLGDVKFYECNLKSLTALHAMEFKIQIGNEELHPTTHEKNLIKQAISYVVFLEERYKKKFLDSSILKSEIFS